MTATLLDAGRGILVGLILGLAIVGLLRLLTGR